VGRTYGRVAHGALRVHAIRFGDRGQRGSAHALSALPTDRRSLKPLEWRVTASGSLRVPAASPARAPRRLASGRQARAIEVGDGPPLYVCTRVAARQGHHRFLGPKRGSRVTVGPTNPGPVSRPARELCADQPHDAAVQHHGDARRAGSQPSGASGGGRPVPIPLRAYGPWGAKDRTSAATDGWRTTLGGAAQAAEPGLVEHLHPASRSRRGSHPTGPPPCGRPDRTRRPHRSLPARRSSTGTHRPPCHTPPRIRSIDTSTFNIWVTSPAPGRCASTDLACARARKPFRMWGPVTLRCPCVSVDRHLNDHALVRMRRGVELFDGRIGGRADR
jgi:hypothetical protein